MYTFTQYNDHLENEHDSFITIINFICNLHQYNKSRIKVYMHIQTEYTQNNKQIRTFV